MLIKKKFTKIVTHLKTASFCILVSGLVSSCPDRPIKRENINPENSVFNEYQTFIKSNQSALKN